MKKNILFIVIALICFGAGIAVGYVVRDNSNSKVDDKEPVDSNEPEVKEELPNLEDNQDEEEIESLISFDEVKSYTTNDVSKIELTIPCDGCDDPESSVLVLCEDEDIEYFLSFINEFTYVGEFPTETDLGINPYVITIFNNDYEELEIVFNGNGVTLIVADEYQLSNTNLLNELNNKYSN